MEKNQPYKQDKVFDNILETEEFNVYTKIDDLPLDENPMYLEEGINGICTGGSALFNVFGNKRRIVSNDLVVIFPFQLASVTEISSDFSNIVSKSTQKPVYGYNKRDMYTYA